MAMATITVRINEQSKAGKALKDLIQVLSSQPGVEVITTKEKSPYKPEFVAKIKRAEKRSEYTEVDTKNVWGSLGLK